MTRARQLRGCSSRPSRSSATGSTRWAWPSPRSAGRATVLVQLPGVKDQDRCSSSSARRPSCASGRCSDPAAGGPRNARGHATAAAGATTTTAPPAPRPPRAAGADEQTTTTGGTATRPGDRLGSGAERDASSAPRPDAPRRRPRRPSTTPTTAAARRRGRRRRPRPGRPRGRPRRADVPQPAAEPAGGPRRAEVALPARGRRIAAVLLGPARARRAKRSSRRLGRSSPDGPGWCAGRVKVVLSRATRGIDLFNAGAGTVLRRRAHVCPTAQLAIVLDSDVMSAPAIQQADLRARPDPDHRQLRRGRGEGPRARAPLRRPARRARAAAGPDGLGHPRQGLAAGRPARRGMSGSPSCAIFMVAYYRLLGLVAMLSLALGRPAVELISVLGEYQDLALTLAGVTGIIVSIGVSVDSNVVFFEHLKEDVAHGPDAPQRGRRARSHSAFRTIVKADVAVAHRRRPALVADGRSGARLRPVPGLSTVLDLHRRRTSSCGRRVLILVGQSRLAAGPSLGWFGMPGSRATRRGDGIERVPHGRRHARGSTEDERLQLHRAGGG